jgi:hypothetical protein
MTPDVIGYVASSLVFAAYCMKKMISLRITAICSNVAFIAYGLSLGHPPIWLLHAALLPLNGWRLVQAVAWKRKAAAMDPAGRQRRPYHRIGSCRANQSGAAVNGIRNPSEKLATGSNRLQ